MTELVRTKNARGGEGREIDEWSVKLPEGKSARFKVILDYQGENGAIRFRLRTEHPNFAKLRIMSGDLASLREDLSRIAADIIRRDLSDGWEPAQKVEFRHEMKPWPSNATRFEMTMTLTDVEHMPGERVGNRGETVTRDAHRQEVVVQRGHEDDFSDIERARPASNSIIDPELSAYMASPFYDEMTDKVSRVVRPGRGAEVKDLMSALSGFSTILAERLSPDGIAREGFPSPEDLVTMMEDAVREEISHEPS